MGCATNEHYRRLILLAPVTHVDLSHAIYEQNGWLVLLALVTPLHRNIWTMSTNLCFNYFYLLCYGAANIMVLYVVLLGKCEKAYDKKCYW